MGEQLPSAIERLFVPYRGRKPLPQYAHALPAASLSNSTQLQLQIDQAEVLL
jgi:hypothetical protein